jgi:hypothetical protein
MRAEPMILAILLFIAFGSAVAAVAHSQNRHVSRSAGRGRSTTRSRASRSGAGRTGAGRGSWLLRAWNASGAPKTSETTLGGAAAIATGKAAGAATRGGWLVSKKTGRAGRWFASRTLIPFDKWLAKKKAGMENAASLPDRPADATRKSAPAGPELSWRDQHERERLYQRYAELRRVSGSPLPLAQFINEVEPHPDEGELLHRLFSERFERENGTTFDLTQPAATPPPVFVHPTKKSSKGASVSRSTVSGAAPSTLAAHVNYINDFEPESDADLLNMMGAEVAGKAAEAEAYQELFDRCVSGAGLDPQAMQGVSDYAEAIAESAEAMKRAHAQFVAVYGAILEATENGTVLPHDGRFFSGEANVA